MNPQVFDYIEDDKTVLEEYTLSKLSEEGELKAYIHNGFWKPMDSKREHEALEAMWSTGNAPWKKWKD